MNNRTATDAERDEIKNMISALSPADLAWADKHWADSTIQVFTFTEIKTRKTIHVNVTKLVEAIGSQEVPARSGMMALPEDLYLQLLGQQGIERSHLAKISIDTAVYHPAIIIECDEDDGEFSHIIADGNHKLVKSYELGLRRHPSIMVKREHIEPYLFKMPPAISELMQRLTTINLQLSDVVAEILGKEPCRA